MNQHSLYFESQPGVVEVAFYLPNPPKLPRTCDLSSTQGLLPRQAHCWQVNTDTAVDELIKLNGNHWRKIFTIMAKLCANQPPCTQAWRALRSKLFVDTTSDELSISALSRRLHFLSQVHEPWDDIATIKLKSKLDPKAKWHIVCGLKTQSLLGINHTEQSRTLDEQAKIKLLSVVDDKPMQGDGTILLTPYLDYRQFPNHLIEHVHALLNSSNE
jgi:hypothetical protein